MTSPIVPTLPISKLLTQDGYMHHDWQVYFEMLHGMVTTNLSPEGTQVPTQNASNIGIIAAKPNTNPRLVVDEGTGDLKYLINGLTKTVTVT